MSLATAAPTPPEQADPDCALRIEGVSKYYVRADARATTLKEGLLGALSKHSERRRVTALEGINLTVRRGEAFGLIGPNGSGKSTLLKLMSGITEPSRGRVETNGRVLGLIELGAGFHPDLTGEENIRLQAAIYGLGRLETRESVEHILDFANLRDFRHMPVKHYSSGMFLRLGFAIAVQARPDILLVDEVLAVGDQAFQEQCIHEIRRQCARGMTLIFVTHFPEQAERLCHRVAWLDAGHLRMQGAAPGVLAEYHNDLIARRYNESQGRLNAQIVRVGQAGRFGSGEARIEQVRILDREGRPCAHFRMGEPMLIEVDYTAQPGVEAVDCILPLDGLDGTTLAFLRAERDAGLSRPVNGHGRFHLKIDDLHLLPGRYCLTISISPPGDPGNHFDILYKLFHFTIEPVPGWDTVSPIEIRGRVVPEPG